MTLGERIKHLRTENKITQETLAEKLNVSRSAIAKWESDRGLPELNNVVMIASLFNISLDELVNEQKTPGTENYECKSSEYTAPYCDIELEGWNDGVYNVLIIGEDKDFLFYLKKRKNQRIFGAVGKRYITSVKKLKTVSDAEESMMTVNREYFCDKRVSVELAKKEGILAGLLDFRDNDFQNVIIRSIAANKIILEFDRKIEIKSITKIEDKKDE